jgi:hypothetical protein
MHIISLSPGIGISVGYYRKRFCDDNEIGRRTTTQQPTNKRRRGAAAAAVAAARQRGVVGSLAAARRWRQRERSYNIVLYDVLVSLYIMVAHRRQFMPFWLSLQTAGERLL